jgi:hypothetical protein
VGKKDVITRGFEIAVHWCGFDIDVSFWTQHVSFLLVGAIVVTSIRGLLLTLTKVRIEKIKLNLHFKLNFHCSFSTRSHLRNPQISSC